MTPLPDDAVARAAVAFAGIAARQSVEYQDEHLYQNYTRNLGGYMLVLVFLAFAAMVMRAWCRIGAKQPFERDDWTYFVGSTIAIGSFIVMLLYTFDAGLGEHWVALTPEQKALFPKLNFAFNILNVLSYPLIKISFLLLYIRVFYPLVAFVRVMWGAIAFVTAVMIANTCVSIFSCTPVRGFFDPTVPAKCIDSVAYYYWTAVINCVQDLFILAVPLPVLWKRKISHKKAVIALFMMGGLTFVLSILRIVFYTYYTADDPSYSFLDSGYASSGEVGLAVIVASAPTWKPVWRYFALRIDSLSSRGRNHSGSEVTMRETETQTTSPLRSVVKKGSSSSSEGIRVTTSKVSNPRSDGIKVSEVEQA